MRKFKTAEELERERKEALGLIPFKMPTDKLILIYARQSTKGQVLKRKESALQQTEEQLDRALDLGWPAEKRLLFIENQAKDGKIRNASGRLRIDEREGLNTVMLYINSDEASAVMARDVARLFRDDELVGPVVFAKACRENHVLVITEDYIYDFNHPKRGRDDYKKFIEEAQAAADYLEKHQKGVLLKNRERKAQRGEFSGHGVPVGFMLDEDRAFYVPNPDHAKPLKALFKRFRALGGNPSELRREIVGKPIFPDLPPEILERTGRICLTKVPGGWTIKSSPGLARILTNPAYIGHISYRGRIVKKNAHPAIVDEDDFWFAYYRLAETDFEGNPIERPTSVTKRYRQKNSSPRLDLALFEGLRDNGTPVIVTNISEKASLYVKRDGRLTTYTIEDRSRVAVQNHTVRIKAAKLDTIFSERLIYRAGEALRNSGEYPMEDEDTEEFEHRRREIHEALIEQLQEAEKPESEQQDPLKALRDSIVETQGRIAEKERVSDAATDVMSVADLRKHFKSLSKLRRSLAQMEQKLERAEKEEQAQEEAKGKLPEVYEKWYSMAIEAKQRFIRVATAQVTLDEIVTSWLKLTIEWSPVVGQDLIDEAYIWTTAGERWTDEEKNLLREHYATASRNWLMEQLPYRSWDTIAAKGQEFGIKRPHMRDQNPTIPYATISINDWKFIRENELPLEEMLENRVYWREYIALPREDNREAESRQYSPR